MDSGISIDLSNGGRKRDDPDEPAWLTPAAYVLLFVLCLVTFHGITDNYLFNDDFSWMSRARYDMTPSNLFTYRVVNFFRPLINVTFYAFEHLAPGNLKLQYAFNILLHFICSILVLHLFIRLLLDWRQAAAGAALFAVSSIHTGAVFWISARTTLLSTALLLGAILVLTAGKERGRFTVVSATALFALSLLAKETAIAGLPILLIIWFLYRDEWKNAVTIRASLISWSVVSIAYLITRRLVIGGFTQHNWGPGLHMLRNTAGGFLYQLRPWPFFSLFYHEGTMLREPVHPFLPELLIIGALAFIWYLGSVTGKRREFMLGTLWALAALVPASAFRYRFFSTASITQNRYYYLSSVGTVLLFVLVLGLLWNSRKKVLKVLCIAVLCVFIAGSIVRVNRLERVWNDFSGLYKRTVDFVIAAVEDKPGFTAAAIENPPLAFPYIADAVSLYRPGWKINEVEGGYEQARSFAPCIYIPFVTRGGKVESGEMRVLR
jgi:hypothetical protein